MAYNLPMQINLQAPPASNISAIKKSIEAGIGNIKVSDIGTASFAKANAQVKNLTKTFDKGEKAATSFFDAVEGKARSYAAYAVASTAVLKLAGTVSQATREAIKYEKELINIAQTTGDSIRVTKDYSSSLVDISKKYNISLSKTAQLTRLLAQTGMGFRDAAKGAEILARTSLLAGFDDLQDTTEGLIATMQTFEVGVIRAGKVLESINTLSKKYAVESGDLVEAIRRAGAAFSTSGGQIEELLALFTAVRSTTRESAETIATGFRTIFARLQRPKTIEFFKQLGIELETAEGKFIGPYQAILKISEGLQRLNIQAGDVRFAEVVEQIGGIRQISRVVPLLEQVRKAQDALALANDAGIDSVEDLKKAQQGLGYRLGVLQKEFGALISEVVNSSSFKFLVDIFINLSSAAIQFTKALAPLMPFLATMAAWKISSGLGKLLSGGYKGVGNLGMGGMKMASGGLVPGNGNRDTVPAMLTPGEFVIRKSAVNAIGASRLASINKYASGGYVQQSKRGINNQILSWGDIDSEKELSSAAKGSIKGVMFERLLRKRLGRSEGTNVYPDFPNLSNKEKGILGIIGPYTNAEAKLNKSGGKPTNDTAIVYAYAKGGSVGTDTVPAMLTPGEFVVNKKSAQAYGYANLKKINKYKNGGMVGSARGDISTDIQRGTGNLIYTFEELEKELNNIVDGLGSAGDKIKNMGLQAAIARPEQMKRKDGRIPRGSFNPEAGPGKTPVITATAGVGTQSTVAHELGHAVDYGMGGGKGYASEQQGTLQNTLAKLAKGQIETALRAKGVSEEDIKYRTDLKELFADLFEKSEPEVRAILASTTDVNEGMHKLATVLDYSVASYSRLYGDIQKNLEEAVDASGRATFKVVGQPTTQPSATAATPVIPSPPTLTAKQRKAKQRGLAGNEAIEKQIQEAAKRGDTEAVDKLRAQARSNKQAAGQLVQQTATGGTPSSFAQFNKNVDSLGTQVQNSSKKVQTSSESLSKSIKSIDINFVSLAAKAQIAVSALSTFAGLNVNQAALTTGQVKGAGFSLAGDAAGFAASRKNVFLLGKSLEKLPFGLGKFGTSLAKNAGSLSKMAGGLSKGLNVLAGVEVIGSIFDALLSTNYGAIRDNFIAVGDAAGAATAATQAYAQEQYRAIPLIGGFLAGLGFGSDATEESLDANGKLAVSNARLEASINGVDKEVNKAKRAFSEAQSVGDIGGQQKAISAQLDAADKLKSLAIENQSRAQSAGGGSFLGGAAGGAMAGAGIGALVGGPIGAGIGLVAGALAGGVGQLMYSSNAAKDQIVKAYGLQADAIRKSAEVQTGLIGQFSDSLQSESVRVIRAGGTYEDALKNVTDQIGEENVNRILDGRKLGADPKEDIKMLGQESSKLDKEIAGLKEKRDGLTDSDKVKRAEIDAQIAAAESEQQKVDKLREGLVATQAAIDQEKKLMERRALEAAAMEYQIGVMKKLERGYDAFNAKARELSNISQEIDNIGTGKLTTRQAAAQAGVTNPQLFEMDAKEIMRNPEVASQMAAAVTRSGGPGEEITKAQQRLDTISQVGGLAKSGALSDIMIAAKEGSDKASAQDIQDAIYEKLQIKDKEADPVLNESIRKYAERIAEGGLSAAGQAEEDARSEATKQSEEIIARQQEKFKELFEAEQKYRDLQIEQINRQAELSKKVYENEKAYFEERFNLITKVQDFLQQEPTGPGKAGFLAARGANRRDVAMAGLEMRRGAGFGGVNTEVNKLSKSINDTLAKRAGGEDVGTAFADIQNESDKLINTIRDEIGIQEQYLDSLMDSAKAQQEYTQSLYDAQGAIVRDLVTGTDEEVGNQLRTLNAAAMAAQQGSFAGIPESMKKDIFNVFDQFADVVIPGLGVTGRDAQREITKNEYMSRFGVNEAKAAEMASKAVQDRVPVDQRMAEQIKVQEEKMLALLDEEKRVKNDLLKIDADNNAVFGKHVTQFGEIVAGMKKDLGTEAPGPLGNIANPIGNSMISTIGQAVAAPGNMMGQIGQILPSIVQGFRSFMMPAQNNNAPVATPMTTGQNAPGGAQSVQVQTQGQQEIIVRLPDIQALVNQAITATLFETVAETFTNIANDVRSATNFDDVANAMSAGVQRSVNKEVGGNA